MRPKCRFCARPLAKYIYADRPWARGEYGYGGCGVFCSLRCGFKYGLAAAVDGRKAP